RRSSELQGGAAFGVAGVGGGPGPLVFEGEVEPLDLAVGLRPVRPRALVLDPGVSRGLAEVLGAVAGAVVGQHPLHGDVVSGEPRQRPCQERRGGVAAFVVADLGVGQARAVVDSDVDVVVAELGARPATPPLLAAAGDAGSAAVDTPAAAVGDAALLFDVDVDQLAGPVALVAHHRPGGPVDVTQPRQA